MDLKLAWRSMTRTPGFAVVIAATMALGVGANATMFGVFRAVFLRPLPFSSPDRLVTVWESDPERGIVRQRVTGPNFVDWEAQSHAFDAMGTLPNWTGQLSTFNVIGVDSVERIPGLYASSGFFRVLGVEPMLGRTLIPADDSQQGRREAVISHAVWTDRFGGDAAVLGRTLEIDTYRGGAFTIVGVMPRGFDFPHGSKMWLSLGDWGGGSLPSLDAADRCCPWHAVFARLKPGVTPEAAAAELTAISVGISQRHPDAPRVTAVRVVPLHESLVGDHRLALGLLFAAVASVLLIGCANIANLFLSRGVSRRRELFTQMALGATRWRLARQLILESLLLGAIGATTGLLIAGWAQRVLGHSFEGRIPLVETTKMDATVFAFTALLTMVIAVICGLGGQTEGLTRSRLRSTLVVGEVAVSVVLVATAGLLIRSFAKLQAVDAGFRRERILTVSMDVSTSPLRGRGNAARFLEELISRVSAMPGVQRVGAATRVPLEGQTAEQAITREDRPPLLAAESPHVAPSAVTPGYFAAIGVPLRKGRFCTEADAADGTLVSLINETAARRYWPGEDPIGKRYSLGSRERYGYFRAPAWPGAIEWREIVGVVGDIRSAGFGADVQPEVYHCYKQSPIYDPQLFVRTAGDPMSLAGVIRQTIGAVSNRAVVVRVRTMDDVADRSLNDERLRARLVGAFSSLALALGMMGIYGVLSYIVGGRTKEIGIRMALGADRTRVSLMVVGQALRLTAFGIVLGLAGAAASGRWIASLLFGVRPFDALTFVVACLLMLAAAVVASAAPAWKAMRVEPAIALRSE